ncbi:hypothetical protein [Haloparvum sp. PAK95]|uniref:hypothetical protein n=1 Tax=Haloparvum sp. PAK95 TaxID=3418962 RepID=UPI003D2F4D49
MSNGSADCPVADCGFSDIPSLVAAHVNGTSDADHDWDELPFDGPGAFLSAARADGPTMPTDAGADRGVESEDSNDARDEAAHANDETDHTSDEADDAPDNAGESGTKAAESDAESRSNRGSRAIAGDPEPLPVRCPVDGCSYTGPPKSVAAHVSGKRDPPHDMRKIDYPNAEAFPPAPREADETGEDSQPVDPDHPFDVSDVERAAEVAVDEAEDVDALDDLPLSKLVDLHVAFSVLASEASSLRRDLKSAIVDRVEEDGEIEGRLGAVERSTGTRRSLRDEAVVQSRLLGAGIDPADVQSFDPDLVDDAIEDADLDESAFFETRETDRLRRADVNEDQFSPES